MGVPAKRALPLGIHIRATDFSTTVETRLNNPIWYGFWDSGKASMQPVFLDPAADYQNCQQRHVKIPLSSHLVETCIPGLQKCVESWPFRLFWWLRCYFAYCWGCRYTSNTHRTTRKILAPKTQAQSKSKNLLSFQRTQRGLHVILTFGFVEGRGCRPRQTREATRCA